MMKTFTFMMIMSSPMVCMESKSWWEYWILLEINSMAFIIFMLKESKKEKIFIFLMFQNFSSAMLMMYIFLSSWSMDQSFSKTITQFLMMSILLKIGLFPFHNWVIKIMGSMSWLLMTMMFSWQKLIPILMVMKMMEKTKMMIKAIIMSIFFMNFIVVKLSATKVIMTISSLMHNTWLLVPIIIKKEASMLYLASYTVILVPLMSNFMKANMKNVAQQPPIKNIKKEMKFLMMSISGIPPSIGFLMKMMVLTILLKVGKKMTWMFILAMSSCVTFYVYLQMFMKHFFYEMMKTTKKNYLNKKNETKEMSWVVIFLPILMWC